MKLIQWRYQGQLYLGTGIVFRYMASLTDLNGCMSSDNVGRKKGGGPEPVKWVGLSADPNLPNSMVAVFSNNQLGAAETNNGRSGPKLGTQRPPTKREFEKSHDPMNSNQSGRFKEFTVTTPVGLI